MKKWQITRRAEIRRRNLEWAKLYKSGATLRQIAAQYGVSHEIVRRGVLKSGVPMRGTGARKSG